MSLESLVLQQINSFIKEPDIDDILKNTPKLNEKLIIINNSFLFRDNVDTIKSKKYLAIYPDINPVTNNSCFIIEGFELKKDFILVDRNDKKIKKIVNITQGIQDEIKELGEIVFVLMGEIDLNICIQKEIDHSTFKYVLFKPSLSESIKIENDSIYCNSLDDEYKNWELIEKELKTLKHTDDIINKLKLVIGKAFDDLKKEAYLNLIIPQKFDKNTKYFLDLINDSIIEQKNNYQNFIAKLNSAVEDRQNILNEILRISYNFSDDALTLIRLVISVCDLKPIILWCTFFEHFKLTNSIKNLPWSKQETKPSLKNYIETIKKARNKSFHRLLPFSKAFEIKLPNNSIKDISLRIFSEYTSKKLNKLEYKDKELVEVLIEFTRTSEEIVSDEFWIKNFDVLNNTVNLIKLTADTIRLFI
jgi:hypothetical protein